MTMPATRRIEPPSWLQRVAVRTVLDVLPELRFVGGAVRNSLLGRPIGDIDAATPRPPLEVMHALEAAGIRSIPTGLAHGTVSALVSGETIEITTLRRDVETDGRHALIEFTDDWAADAARRDFTMNALYIDGTGNLWDPIGGLDDCLAGYVRFVGDPDRRIEEDFLRSLRFYRMHAYYGQAALDSAGRAACRRHEDALTRLSGERIQTELLKLLAAHDPLPAVEMMREDGVLAPLLPAGGNTTRLKALLPVEPEADALRRLAALLSPTNAAIIAERLRLSARQHEHLVAITADAPSIELDGDLAAQRRMLYQIGPAVYRDRVLLQSAGDGRTDAASLVEYANTWQRPELPVRGSDILSLGVPAGPEIGALLGTIERWWIEGDFTASRQACLAELQRLVR